MIHGRKYVMGMTDQEKRERILRAFAKNYGIHISHFHSSGTWFESTTDPVGMPSTKYQNGGDITREYRVTVSFDAIVEDIYLYRENPRHGKASQESEDVLHLGSRVIPLTFTDEFIDLPDDIYEEMFIDSAGCAISKRPNIAYRKDHVRYADGTFRVYRRSYELSLCGKYVVERTYVEYVGSLDPNNYWQCDECQGYTDTPGVFKYPNNCDKVKRVSVLKQ